MSTSGKTSANENGPQPSGKTLLSRRVVYFVVFGLIVALITGIAALLIYGDIVSRLNSDVRRVGRAVAQGVAVKDFAVINNDRVFPVGIAAAPDGTFYLSLLGNGAIQKVRPDGEIRNWQQVTAAGAITPGADGSLYVIDYTAADFRASGRLLRIAPDGRKAAFGGAGTRGLPLFSQLAVDGSGNVYVSHPDSATIWRVTPDGTSSVWWAMAAVGQAKAQPVGVAFDPVHQALVVGDAATGTIYRADLSTSQGTDGSVNAIPLYRQNGLDVRTVTVDDRGRVLVMYWRNDGGVLARLEDDGRLVTLAEDFRAPLGILYQRGTIYVVNSELPGLIQQIGTHPPFTVDAVTLPSELP